MKIRPAWLIAIAALTSLATTFAITLFIHPPGAGDTKHQQRLTPIMLGHLATIDNRLQESELYTDTPISCPLEWQDTYREGRHAYTVRTTVHFAHYDEIRTDFVPTCAPEAAYYAISLEGTWGKSALPVTMELAADRYYGYEPIDPAAEASLSPSADEPASALEDPALSQVVPPATE